MTVYRRKDRANAWWFEFEIRSERHRGRCLDADGRPVATKTAALEVETRERAAVLAGRIADRRPARASDYTFALAAAAALLGRVTGRGRKEIHVANQRLYVNEIVGFFGAGASFRELTQERSDAYVASPARRR